MAYIRWFDELGREDVPVAGGKGANLGEMTRAGLPVPPGFVVGIEAFARLMATDELGEGVTERLAGLDVDDTAALQRAAEEIQRRVVETPVPDDVRRAITEAYARIEPAGAALVAVRSSATAEDTAQFSFAGMFRSFLNVRGADDLVDRVRECWASAFGARVLFYRVQQAVSEVPVAVVVQRMVASEKAGVLFTVDPATGDTEVLVIEAARGLGEVVVGGDVTPDRYEVDRETLATRRAVRGRQSFMLVADPERGGARRVEMDGGAAPAVLTPDEIRSLAELGLRAERHYDKPQDLEWAIADGEIAVVQTRPITALAPRRATAASAGERPGRVLVRGSGASPGVATGPVRILASPADGARLERGEVLVTRSTSPDWVPIMRRAAAIVTDAGGTTSHAAIVSRELGIPCIVGTRDGTRTLADGRIVTVDGRRGVVLEGRVEIAPPAAEEAIPVTLPTRTKLYVNLAEPERAAEIAAMPVDGVGLLRAEFMLLAALENTHPRLLLEQRRGNELVERLAAGLRTFASAFHPRPVIYRTTDFRSNEFRGLAGGERFEPVEENPMLGYRGCFRYTREPDLFGLELRAVREVRADFDNLHLMIPFVRTGSEFRACKALIDASGLTADPGLELWVMAEVPSVVSWLDEYVRLGATGVSIGSNDLTQLILGLDRDSELVAPLFDERDRAVLDVIRAIVTEARRLGITSSICGQAPSVYPEFVQALVQWGIDSISVNPDAIAVTRRHIVEAERALAPEPVAVGADDGRATAETDEIC